MQNKGGKKPSEQGTTYSRGDDGGLWDDGYLIQLWNEQLELMNTKKELKASNRSGAPSSEFSSGEEGSLAEEHSTSSAETEGSEENSERSTEEPTGCGRAFRVLANAASSNEPVHKAKASETSNSGGVNRSSPRTVQTCPLPVGHLPEDVQALVVSFYTAGFEAGRYAATHGERKRQRD